MKSKIIKFLTTLTIIIYVSIDIFTKEIILDELWNFSNATNIANGLIPYKDFNLIVTPFTAFLHSITLRIFGTKLYIFRINHIILTILLIFSISKLISKFNLTTNKKDIFILTITYSISVLLYNDYNFLNLIFLILILYLETKNNTKQNKYLNLTIGILGGLTIITKQTTGLIVSFTILTIPLITNILYKENKKKPIIIRLLGISLIILIFLLYIYKNNILYDFIDCTILGLTTFQKPTNYNIYYIIDIILIIISIIYLLKELYKIIKFKEKKQKIDLILLIYSISSLTLNYPMLDFTHFLFSIIPTIIYYIKNHKFKLKVYPLAIIITLILVLNYENIINIKKYHNNYNIDSFKTYQYIKLDKIHTNEIISVTKHIKNSNKKILIIDHSAIVYSLALNTYNHYFDIPLAGNIGSIGETEMIKILQNNDINIMIDKKPHTLKKELPNLYKYITNNYKKIDKIKNFQVLTKLT